MLTVTDSFKDKTSGALARISPHLIATPPALSAANSALRKGRVTKQCERTQLGTARISL
jgi:hypothetical protein